MESLSGTLPPPLIEIPHRLGTCRVRFGSLGEAFSSLSERGYAITDRNVESAWGSRVPASWKVHSVAPGEASKSLQVFGECHSWLASAGADRKASIVAFGGGVVGDLAGFVAATYMRGVPYVQIPTTLLSQIDSSVGGKVAIDLPEGKNLVGAFYPPVEVWICLETLKTLPWREFVNGMAEAWKYGFILDEDLVRALRHTRLNPESPMLERIVHRCIELKAEVVRQDETDTSGIRAVLNFGHTVGHAIERVSGYKGILHGEAIAVGMVAEAAIGERIGITETGTSDEIRACLDLDGLPTFSDHLRHPDLIEAMRSDKKAEGGELAFSLLSRVGECKLVRNVPREEVEAALSAL